MRKIKEPEFWVSNVSDRNVCVSDLALTIPARRSVNLLDSKHYSYTSEELELSSKSGSLYKKRDKLKVRMVAPDQVVVKPGVYTSNAPLFIAQSKLRSAIVVEEPKYKELQITEESFAEQMTNDDE